MIRPLLRFLPGCFFLASAWAAEPAIVARVGTEVVKVEEVRAYLSGLDEREQAALARDPAALSQAVRTLLVQRLILAEAQDKHWDRQPDVAAKLERARQSVLLESYLQSVAAPPAEYPLEDQLRAAYEANKASYQVPRQYRLAQIFVASPREADPTATARAKAKLDGVAKKLADPRADFAALARAESEERESGARGGEIGWLAEAQVQPDLRARVIGLAAGAVSEPRQLADGWHILKMLEVKEAHLATLEEVRQPLAQQLRAERTRSNAQAYLARLSKEAPIALNELALADVLAKPGK